MEIQTVQPFVAGSLRWQGAPEAWTMTVVVKLTLALKAGTMTIAREPEPIRERDLRRASDPEGRVNAPCDLAPFKSGAEVMVVGHGPRGGSAQLGRIAVAGIDKVIEVTGQEMLLGGELGPSETKWPPRADGKAPVAMTFVPTPVIEAPLGAGVPRDFFHTAPADQQIPVLRGDESVVLENLHPKLGYLSTRLPGIRPRTRVEMEGMQAWEMPLTADTLWIDTDRSMATLVFRGQLSLGSRDQAGRILIGVERPGGGVVFPDGSERSHDVSPPPAVVHARRRPSAPAPAPPPEFEEEGDELEQTQTNGDKLARTGAAIPYTSGPALPFFGGPGMPAHPDETSVFAAPAIRPRTPTWLGGMDAPPPEPTPPPGQVAMSPGQGPIVPGQVPVSPGQVPVPPPSQVAMPPGQVPIPPPPPSTAGVRSIPAPMPSNPGAPVHRITPAPFQAVQPPSLAFASNRASQDSLSLPAPPPSRGGGTTVGQAAMAQPSIGQGTIGQGIGSIGQGSIGSIGQESRPLGSAPFLGAADASNSAAKGAAVRASKPGIPVSPAAAPPPPRAIIDFLWCSPALPSRLSEREAWRRILRSFDRPAEEEAAGDEELVEGAPLKKKRKIPPPVPPHEKTLEERAREERSRVTRVLVRGEPTIDVEAALFGAVDEDGVLTPPLVVTTGEVELPFDEIETLRILVSAATPLAALDKKLKETIDLATDALGTPLGASPDIAASHASRVREAWQKANRVLSADYLEVHTRRILLEQRKYQTRDLMGELWIRAILHGPQAGAHVPTYIPAELTKKLPLFVKFPARLIAEVLPAQDQTETHPAALRVLAIARVISANTAGRG